MKVLITGASGFIGSYLAKYCCDKGDEVHLCDNNSRGVVDDFIKRVLENKNATFIEADLTKEEELLKLDEHYDTIFHLAAINGTENFYKIPYTVMEVSLKSTTLLLEKYGHRNTRFIFSSSSEVYAGTIQGNPGLIPTSEDVPCSIEDVLNERFSYGGGKLACEILINSFSKQYGLEYKIIRYHNIYGPRMGTKHVIPQFIMRSKKREEPYKIYGDKETRAFCFIDDAVTATYDVSKLATNGVYHIGNDEEEIKIFKLAKMINSWYDHETSYSIENSPKGSVCRRCPDISKIKKEIGYKPQTSLEDGIGKTIEWYDKWYNTHTSKGLL